MSTDTPDLHLASVDLCSKWGFGDGDEPDWVMDFCEANGRPFASVDWHPILRDLVRRYLLPALAEHHDVEVYDIETIHNPIRARVIDGQAIDDYAAWDAAPTLTPAGVTVPGDEVARLIRQQWAGVGEKGSNE